MNLTELPGPKADRKSAAKTICVGLVESDPLRLLGYQAVLEASGRYQVFSDLPEMLLRESGTTVWLVGNVGGVPALRQVEVWRRIRRDLRLLIVGRGNSDADVLRALSAGAKGYIDEAAAPAEFVAAVGIVAEGSVWAPRRLLSQLLESVLERPTGTRQKRMEITAREQEVLELLVEGRTNRQISRLLQVEERTIKAHVAKLLRKFGVENRIALSMEAIHQGLVADSNPAV